MARQVKKTEDLTYDVAVIGGGSAGFAAAESALAAGAKKVCIIEHGMLGGECPTWACVPTKALLRAAKLYHQAKFSLPRFGIRTGKVSYDFPELIRRKDAVVNALTNGGERLAGHARQNGIDVYHENTSFTGKYTLALSDRRLKATAFVIATGSKEVVLDIPGIETVRAWYSRELVSLEALPKSIIIIGGGPIGSEFATFFACLGVRTTIIQNGPQILPREDGEIAAIAEAELKHLGVRILTKTLTLGVKKIRSGVEVIVQTGRKPRQKITAETLAVAIGRRANIDGLRLDKAGVKIDDHGVIISQSTCQTTAPHIFVAGDARGGPQFTHLAHYEGGIAGWNAARLKSNDKPATAFLTVLPHVTFTEPEVASFGLTPAVANKKKIAYDIYRFPVGGLGRAAVEGVRVGLLKVVVNKADGKIIGAHLASERAGEVIHELALAMHAGIPFRDVQSMMHAYPTWSEVIPASSIL